MNELNKLPHPDKIEILGQAIALAAGAKPAKVNPWATDYHRYGDLTLSGLMGALGQPVGSFMSSSDLASTLTEAVRTLTVEALRAPDLTHRRITRLLTTPDFKTARLPRCNPLALREVDNTGAVATLPVSLSEAELSNVGTHAGIVNFSRQAIVNSDWDLLASITEELAIAAFRAEAAAVFGLLASNPTMLDGKALFHPDHGNIASVGGAPSLTTLASCIQAMSTMAVGGVNLQLRPGILVAPTGLESDLAALFDAGADRLVPGGFITAHELPAHVWYLLPSPEQRAVVGLAHLPRGTEPELYTQGGFTRDGLGVRCRHTFGPVALSPYAVMNAGM